jgi:hypothetical protein
MIVNVVTMRFFLDPSAAAGRHPASAATANAATSAKQNGKGRLMKAEDHHRNQQSIEKLDETNFLFCAHHLRV